MDAKLESIERRAKTLGWKCWGPHSPPDNTNIVLLSPDAGIELIVDESNYTAAERLLAVYEAGVVEFELTDAVEMIALGQSRKIAINIPGGTKAGRYRLVRVGDVEVGDAR